MRVNKLMAIFQPARTNFVQRWILGTVYSGGNMGRCRLLRSTGREDV